MAERDETCRELIQNPKNIDRIVSLMPEEMEVRFVDDVLDKVSLHDEHYNSKYFNMLVEFLIDELSNIGSEGISCKPDVSSSKLEEDVDLQPESDADSDEDSEGVNSDVDINENVESSSDGLSIMFTEQHDEGSICNSDISSCSMDVDGDDQADFGAYLNVDLESDVDCRLGSSCRSQRYSRGEC